MNSIHLKIRFRLMLVFVFMVALTTDQAICSAQPAVSTFSAQPVRSNLRRVAQALDLLGAPFPDTLVSHLNDADANLSAQALETIFDGEVDFTVHINPEVRVKVAKRPQPIPLQQGGFTPVLVKVVNEGTTTERLRILSPQSGPVYAGMSELSAVRMQRQDQKETEIATADDERFLSVSMFDRAPMTDTLSGYPLEYAIALIYARDPGMFEAQIGFDVGQGNQDIGFRGEVPVLVDVKQGVNVALRVMDVDGSTTTGKFVFRGPQGEVYPPQAKRLAPDFYFQEQIYRHDGELVVLPPGPLTVTYSRGPEYKELTRSITIPNQPSTELSFQLERWVEPSEFGFYSGDHHIHGAGCAHYTMPSLGVSPADMFLQVKGEGLNVGCVLTWGPCFDFQRQFFSQSVDALSEPLTLMKYDLEISGFGSAALGHVCLLNLSDQTYPGSQGRKDIAWPTWTSPVLRWAKEQGAVTGYAHSASGLQINPQAAAKRMFSSYDRDQDATLSPSETKTALLPHPFAEIDTDHDQSLSGSELEVALDRAADELPNLAIPEMNSVGAMEIAVSVAAGLCDFISAMDTARIPEWNMWYHLLNCGFPIKVSGETDFPCMSGSRVGQGRVYVHLGKQKQLDFDRWCQGLAQGRSYVSDGYAHALEFTVNDIAPGYGPVTLEQPGFIPIEALVSFASKTPHTVAQGQIVPNGGARFIGDTVTFHGPPPSKSVAGGKRTIELVVNAHPVARAEIPADGQQHRVEFQVPLQQSSWVALRHFPQLHTNPVDVIIDNAPIRASSKSARWCQETIKQLWQTRSRSIASDERSSAKATFQWAIEQYRRIEAECAEFEEP